MLIGNYVRKKLMKIKIIQNRAPENSIDPTLILTANEIAQINDYIEHYPQARAAVLDALKYVQKRHGWVNDDQVKAIAKLLSMTTVDVDGVATFFNRIYRKPVGRHVILMCDSIACYLTGYDQVIDKVRQHLNINYGETTADNRYTLLPICCLGKCDHAPALLIDEDTYGDLTPDNVLAILESYP